MRTTAGYGCWVRSIQYSRTANLRAAATLATAFGFWWQRCRYSCPAVLVLTKSILSSNRAFALIQSSLRLRSACPEPVEGTGFLAFSARSGAFRNPEFGLLRWDQIKFAGRLFVEQRAFFLISAAPMLVPSGHTYEITRAHALHTGVV